MAADFHAPPVRKTKRRWNILPPMARGSATLEGLEVLQERRDAFGVLLWRTARSVNLWARVDPSERGELATPPRSGQRDLLEEVASTLPDIPALIRLQSVATDPLALVASEVAAACADVSEWAEATGLPATALAFAQSAALVDDESAGLAFEVGRLAARVGEDARAEVWLRRAVGLARLAGEWASYIRAHLELAALFRARGDAASAAAMAHKARRSAVRWRMAEHEAGAFHELFRIALYVGDTREATRHAKDALNRYPEGHPQSSVLAAELSEATASSQARKRS